MGGWASNSKYPFLGSLRSAAQMISYEVSIGFIIIGIIISTGSLSFINIVEAQSGSYGLLNWYWLPHLPMVFLFFISALAETNRPPFDLPEAEHELTAGFHTEYSGMKFAMFFIGEYVSVLMSAAMITVLFFGGWLGPDWLPPIAWFLLKTITLVLLMILIRGSLPRPRYDQLMAFGWKFMLPLSLLNLIITGALILI